MKRKFADDEVEEDEGIIKPDIIFFGEDLGETFHDAFEKDRLDVDLLICMGSSLRVCNYYSLFFYWGLNR